MGQVAPILIHVCLSLSTNPGFGPACPRSVDLPVPFCQQLSGPIDQWAIPEVSRRWGRAPNESEVQLDPIRPMIRAFRGAVNICVLDLAPQKRINEAIVQPQTMAGRTIGWIGPPGDAIAGSLVCHRPTIYEAVQMCDPTVGRIDCANHLFVFVALRFAIEVAHHDCFFGHGRQSFIIGPILIGQMLSLDCTGKHSIARPGTAVRLSVSVAIEQSVDLQEPVSGRNGREVDRINPQRTRRRVDNTLGSSGVHI